MKRTASVAGFLHVEAGRCRLGLTDVSDVHLQVAHAILLTPPWTTIMSDIAASPDVRDTQRSLQLRQVHKGQRVEKFIYKARVYKRAFW